MKKLICAAVLAGSMFAVAEEAAKGAPGAEVKAPAAVKTAEAVKAQPRRFQMTEAQRAQMKARHEQFMANRKAEMEKKILEVVKKHVPDEEKAKALTKDLADALMASRRSMRPRPQMPMKRPVAKPAEKPAATAQQ